MTVPSTPRRAGPFTGTGSAVNYPFTFKVFSASDVGVTTADTNGLETTQTLGSGFSISLNTDQDSTPGGYVRYAVGGVDTALPSGYRLAITGDGLPFEQAADLPQGGNFDPVVIENALDALEMQIQNLRDKVTRSVTVGVTSSTALALPAPVAGQLLGWNATLDGLVNYAPDASSAAGLQIRLANTASAVDNAGLVGFNAALAYSGGVGKTLRDRAICVTDYPFLADPTGVADCTVALAAFETARASGGVGIIPPGTYKTSGDITISKPGAWVLQGAVITTTGALYIQASDFVLDGRQSSEVRFTYSGGINRAIRCLGALSATHTVSAPLAVGATSFTDGSAAAATLAAGDWVILQDYDATNVVLSEFHQVLSVVGSTVNLVDEVHQAFNTFTQQWVRVDTPRKNVSVKGLKVTSTSTGTACIGVDAQAGVIDFTMSDMVFDVKNGLPWNIYAVRNAHVDGFVSKVLIGQKAAFSQVHGGSCRDGEFRSEIGGTNNGALLCETGTFGFTLDALKAYNGAGGTGIYTFNLCTKLTVDNCLAIGDGTPIGFDLAGVRDSVFGTGNIAVNVSQIMRVVNDTATTPDYSTIKNVVHGLLGRTSPIGINVGAGANNNVFLDFEFDSTVTTPVQDAGTGNLFRYRDQTDNSMKHIGVSKFDSAIVAKRVDAGWSGTLALNAALGNEFDITGIDANTQTIPAPTNAKDGQVISITVRNTSGGVLGAFTWNAIFKMVAWTAPANGFSRTIFFKYNGTNWVEMTRSAADIPN